MFSTIFAVLSHRYCGWCHYKKSSWFARLMGGDIAGGLPWYKNWYWRLLIRLDDYIGFYRIGRSWHERYHGPKWWQGHDRMNCLDCDYKEVYGNEQG